MTRANLRILLLGLPWLWSSSTESIQAVCERDRAQFQQGMEEVAITDESTHLLALPEPLKRRDSRPSTRIKTMEDRTDEAFGDARFFSGWQSRSQRPPKVFEKGSDHRQRISLPKPQHHHRQLLQVPKQKAAQSPRQSPSVIKSQQSLPAKENDR